jgi:hypothetical protein
MSSYNLPAAIGSANATGAESVAIAAQQAGVNNNGNATDSAGNLRIDFVHGKVPAKPNDERADGTPTYAEVYGATQNGQWTTKSTIPSARLNPALNNHSDIEAEWAGFPGYVEAAGNYMVTDASGNGTTVTYISQNNLSAGDVVNITGLTASAYNLSSATVATANKLNFTVTNAANSGLITGQWYGKVESTTARTAADGAGLGFIVVPNVVGKTTALALDALKDAGYEAANITTASATTPAVFTVALESNVATLTTGSDHGYAVGDSVVIANLVNGADDASTDASLNGTYTLIAGTTGIYLLFAKTRANIVYHAGLSGVTAKVSAKAGTIKTQSVAAGTASVLTTATITVEPYFAS